jgi:hypothetical protein
MPDLEALGAALATQCDWSEEPSKSGDAIRIVQRLRRST